MDDDSSSEEATETEKADVSSKITSNVKLMIYYAKYLWYILIKSYLIPTRTKLSRFDLDKLLRNISKNESHVSLLYIFFS